LQEESKVSEDRRSSSCGGIAFHLVILSLKQLGNVCTVFFQGLTLDKQRQIRGSVYPKIINEIPFIWERAANQTH
jgi:hypothetical protein